MKTLGTPYLAGASGSYVLPGFAGKDVTVQWSEALQNFVITGWSPAGGGANADLQALLGRWRFTSTISSTFQQTYNFNSVGPVDPYTGIVGTDSGGGPIVILRATDVDVNFPYDFFLLDPDVGNCHAFIFDHPSPNSLTGVHFQTGVLANGNCDSDNSSSLYDATGVRLNTSALLAPNTTDEARLPHPVPPLSPQALSQLIDRAKAMLPQ